jgi:hypothetical protein
MLLQLMQRVNHFNRTIDMALLLFSQHKMIDWLTKQISKHESPVNNKRIQESEEVLGRENIRDYIRKNNGRIHYIDD